MRFFQAVLAASAFAGSALAQATLAFTSTPGSVTAGQPVEITYTAPNIDEPVTITLRKGDPDDLDTIGTLTSDATGGTYTWIPSTSLADGEDYALQITQGNDINYSGQISLTGGSTAAVSSAVSASASSSSALAAITSSASVVSQISSIQSVIASLNSSLAVITNTTTAPVVAPTGNMTSMPRNTTMSSATLSTRTVSQTGAVTSRATQTASATESGSAVPTGNAAAGLGYASPMALIFGAVAAMAYL